MGDRGSRTGTSPARLASTHETVDHYRGHSGRLSARAAILARGGCALVHVDLAVVAGVTLGADTTEHENTVDARTAIQARVRCTLVQVHVALSTSPATGARARPLSHAGNVGARALDALSIVLARGRGAL